MAPDRDLLIVVEKSQTAGRRRGRRLRIDGAPANKSTLWQGERWNATVILLVDLLRDYRGERGPQWAPADICYARPKVRAPPRPR